MGIPHQAFNCKRIIFCLSLFFAMFCTIGGAQAYDSLYVVKDVSVDITAGNSVVAQEKAFNKAQRIAFARLAKRLVQEGQLQRVETPSLDIIASFIKDFEVENEKLSAVRYVGDYTFRFRETAVNNYFSASGVAFTETKSKPLLILPVFQMKGMNTLWSEQNIWMHAWARNQASSGLVPVEVPIGDLSDISDIDDREPLRYERTKLDRMLARYNAGEAAIMIAVPDQNLAQSRTIDEKAIGSLRLSIYRTDRARAEHVQDAIINAKANETVAQLYDRAVKAGYNALQSDWKNKTSASAAERETYTVNIPFGSIHQWVKIKTALDITPGLDALSIHTMRKSGANLSFNFRGNEEQLRYALSRNNLSLGQGYAITAMQVDENTAAGLVYDVRLLASKSQSTPSSFYNGPGYNGPSGSQPGAADFNATVHTF